MKLFFYGVCVMAGCMGSQAEASVVGNNAASGGKGARCDSSEPTGSLVSTFTTPTGKRDDLIASGRTSGKDGVSDAKGTSPAPTREAKIEIQHPAATRPASDSALLVITPRPSHPEDCYTLFPRTLSTIPAASASLPPHILGSAQMSGTVSYVPSTFSSHQPLASATRLLPAANGRLARVTAYWPCEGDYYTRHGIAATGVHLHDGHCAVDPNIIPYGSVVDIAGVGKFLAVDTGSAVISRTAAREGGRTHAERSAIVVDLFFEDRSEGEQFAARDAKYVDISWWTPSATDSQARAARGLFAEEDWTKIQGKQL